MPKSVSPSTAPDTETVSAPSQALPDPASYEQAVAELERLVVAMEGAQLPLDQVLRSYQRGAQLLTYCRRQLDAVEQQVKVLEDGELKPWTAPVRDHAA